MPYRRLPNTDQARIRALRATVEMEETTKVVDLAVSLHTLSRARDFLAKFEVAQRYYAECFARQSAAARKHQKNVKMARLYISHFIQVLDMAVVRAEIKTAHKDFYGLSRESHCVPDLISEAQLVEWGRKIIDGESRRTAQGGVPIYNPTIAKVRVLYDVFVDSYEAQKNLQRLTSLSLDALANMRKAADELILDIWNQVEHKFESVKPLKARLDMCRRYGVIYYYRTGEQNTENVEE